MTENTKLLVLTGVHGKSSGELGSDDNGFLRDSQKQETVLKNRELPGNKADDIDAKNIQFGFEDVGQINVRDNSTRTLDEKKFVLAVKKFNPTVLVLAFCWSHNSELNDLLRAAGIYSTIILREELAQITESRHVRLDEGQENLIKRITEENPKNLFLWGTSGSGKTLMLAEALKMKLSHLRREGKQEIRVIVTTMQGRDPLMKDLQEKYLPDIARNSFIEIRELARELSDDIRYEKDRPQNTLKNLLIFLNAQRSHSSSHTILLVDEVIPMSKEEEDNDAGKADWSSLRSPEGVDFIVSLHTFASSAAVWEVVPPTDSRVLSHRLTTPHRNCADIARYLKFQIEHENGMYLSGIEEDEQAEHLPPGRLPVWMERSQEVTDGEVLDFINENFVAEAHLSVTVLYGDDPNAKAEEWCSEHRWRYLSAAEIWGCENQCVVMIDIGTMHTEFISRGRNLLVIVSTRGRHRCNTLSSYHSICNAGTMLNRSLIMPLSTSRPPLSAQIMLMAIAHTTVSSCSRR